MNKNKLEEFIYTEIDNLSAENNLKIKSISTADLSSFEKEINRNELRKLGVSTTLNGSYDSMKNFLRKIDSDYKLLKINNLEYSFPTSRDALFDFQINLEAYYK